MNKFRTIVLALLVFCPFSGFSQSYVQYFDGADTSWYNSLLIEIDTSASNIWQVGPPQKQIFDTAATAPNVIVTDTIDPYPNNNVSRFSFKIDPQWFGWGVLAVQWKQKLDMVPGVDGGIIEFSVDSGSTWQNAFNNPYVYNFYGFDQVNQDTLLDGEEAFTGTDSLWKDIWLCFDISWLSMFDTLEFRYTFRSDTLEGGGEGWMIDNLQAHITIIHTIDDGLHDKYLKVGPNPTQGRLDVEARKTSEYHIIEKLQLFDLQGRIVKEWRNVPTKFFIDIEDQSDGVYYLKVTTNLRTETHRIVLDKL